MTYQQPILDELNYVAERMRTEDIKKKNEDYEFIEKLKKEREELMKKNSTKEGEDIAKEELFDLSSIKQNNDITPVINTDVEMEYEIIDNNNREQVFIYEDLSFDANYQPLLLKDKTAKKKYEEALKKYSISTNISDTMNRPIEKIKTLPAPSKNEISKELFSNITNNMPINTDLQKKDKKSKSSIASEAETEKYSNIPINKKKSGGRPKGSKNTPIRTLDLTK